MKKFLICLMSILFVFIGCSKMDTQYTDVNYGRTEIVFDSGLITKAATIVDGIVLPNDWSFGVAATHTDKSDFFDGVKEYIKEENEGNTYYKFSGSEPYYWPKTGSMTFYAYAPYNRADNASFDGTNLTINDYDVAGKQIDLLYATASKEISDGLTAEMPLTFNHTLAQLVFQFRKSTLLGSTGVIINSVTVHIPSTKADFSNGTWSNSNPDVEKNYIIAENYTCTDTYKQAKDDDEFLILPQAFGANDTDVVITIDYKTKWVLSTWKNRVVNLTVKDLKTKHTESEWQAGHKYIYNIEVSTSEILFTSSVSNWVDDDNVIY